MTGSEPRKPTPAELEILQVLWKQGPSTVRQVHQTLGWDTGYTTVLKLMQIMFEKGFLRRDTAERTHVYEAAVTEAKTKKRLVRDLLDKAFSGSAKDLVLQALSANRTSKQELAEIRRMIEALEKGEK